MSGLKLSLNTVKRYARVTEPERLKRAPQYRSNLVDPYRDHLRLRRGQEPAASMRTLFNEITAFVYSGSMNLLCRYIIQGRVEGDRPPISPRCFARLLLTRPDRLTDKQIRLGDELSATCPEMIDLADRIATFTELLKPRPANDTLPDGCIATVRAADLPHLHTFAGGLDQDRNASTPD